MDALEIIKNVAVALGAVDKTKKIKKDIDYIALLVKLICPDEFLEDAVYSALNTGKRLKNRPTQQEAIETLKNAAIYLMDHFKPVIGIALGTYRDRLDEMVSRYLATMLLLTNSGEISDAEIVSILRAKFGLRAERKEKEIK